MSANKNNNIFEKTSFLGNNSSEFVETLYDDYLKNPSNLPEEWKNFFDEARLETNAPPLYCGVVPNICDRNPILLRFVIGQSGIVL